jgi:hypothetical protein
VHSRDVQPIWNSRCTGCHGSSGGLNLRAPNGWSNIVDEPSNQLPSMPLVDPGDHLNSYLWHKIDDTHRDVGGSGDLMPGGFLPVAQRDLIRTWIDEGAPP